MKLLKLLLLTATASFLHGATITLTGPTGSGIRAGQTINLTVTLTGVTGTNVAAVQFSVPAIPGWVVTPTVGAAAQAANKSVYCASNLNGLLCFVSGTNATPLVDGVIASLAVALPTTLPAGTSSFTFTNLLGATTTALASTVGAGTPFVLSIVSAPTCDINGDGLVSMADFTTALPQYLGSTTCTPKADLNSDGACNVLDVQILSSAIGGGTCAAK